MTETARVLVWTTIALVGWLVLAAAAHAACPAGATSVTAGPGGAIKVCPAEVDADGDSVGAGFYKECEVRVTSAAGPFSTKVTTLTP